MFGNTTFDLNTSIMSPDTVKRIENHIVALGDPNPTKSYQAERRLIRFGSKAVPNLTEAAASPDPQVRFRAVWALGKIRDVYAYETILRLTQDADDAVAYDATLALAELGDVRALEPLRRMLKTMNGAPEIALARLGDPNFQEAEEQE